MVNEHSYFDRAIEYIETHCWLLDKEDYKSFIDDCPARIVIHVMDILKNAKIDLISLLWDTHPDTAMKLKDLDSKFNLERYTF